MFANGIESEDARCCHCDGNHVPGFPECPVRLKVRVGRVRAVEKVSCVEAVKIVEAARRDDEAMAEDDLQQSVDVSQLRDPEILIV